MFRWVVVLIVLWSGAVVAAAPNAQLNLRFQRLLTADGAEQQSIGAIKDIIQDRHGFMWFAGEYGLARYDSQHFKFYFYDPFNPRSLSSNYIAALAVDKSGVLWLGTFNGLNRYNAQTDDFTRYQEGSGAKDLSSSLIMALAVDAQNQLYIGTSAGLNVLSADRTGFRKHMADAANPNSLSGDNARSLFIDSHQKVWIGTTSKGLNVFDPLTGKFERWRHDANDPASLQEGDIERIYEDHLGQIWVGSYSGGLSRMNADRRTFRIYRSNPDNERSLGSDAIRDIREYHQTLWVATDHGGLAVYDASTDEFTRVRHDALDPGSLRSNQVRDIFEDRDGNVWVGTFPDGVNLYDEHKATFIPHKIAGAIDNTQPLDQITSVFQDSQGLIWVGSETGLVSISPVTGASTRYTANPKNPNSLRFNAVTSLGEDTSGNLWVGTWSGGLHRFNRQTATFKNYYPDANNPGAVASPYISQIARDKTGNLWVCYLERGGFGLYRPDTDSFENFSHNPSNPNSLAYDFVKALLPDSRGNLWLGTLKGLDKFNIATRRFTHYTHSASDPNSLAADHILALMEDSKGNIWVGTKSDGVSILDPTKEQFSRLTTHNGLPSNSISTIIEDAQGGVWLGTINGLAHIDPVSRHVQTYRKRHGLAGSSVTRNAALLDRQQHLWIGSTEGVTEFDPVKVTAKGAGMDSPANLHRVVLTELRLGSTPQIPGSAGSLLSQDLGHTEKLQLAWSDPMFSIDYVGLNFVSSASYDYSYRLEGFDTQWRMGTPAGSATYTNLAPGQYRFRVRAANHATPGMTSETSLAIEITPPFWRTSWAYGLYGLLLLAAEIGRRYWVHLHNQTDKYKTLSATDAMTGIYNRHGLNQIIAGLFINDEMKKGVCLMIFDIDHFKRINDNRGHDAGDRVIKGLVDVVLQNIRSGDHLARWGGEEFVLMCPSTTLDSAVRLAEKIRVAVAAHTFEQGDNPLSVTISMGVSACIKPDDTFDKMLKLADVALYTAKQSGRNCVEVSVPSHLPIE